VGFIEVGRIPKGHPEYNEARMLRIGRHVFWLSTEVEDGYEEWRTTSFGVTTHLNVDLAEEHMDASRP
jgi:hypothetical protein